MGGCRGSDARPLGPARAILVTCLGNLAHGGHRVQEGGDRRAQQLSYLSLFSIVYVLAGGKIAPDGAMFGSSIEFSRPWVVVSCYLLVQFYVAHRYFFLQKILIA